MRVRLFSLKKALALALAFTTTLSLSMPQQGWAMLAPAEGVETAQHQEDLKTVRTALESQMLRDRLAEFQLSPQEIDARLQQLSQEEIHQAALQIESVQPAGDAITYVLVVGILVLLFVYLFRRV
jgi:hypothetical protein